MPPSSTTRSYRKKGYSSNCRKLKKLECVKASGCKFTNGSKRKFCRTSTNVKRKPNVLSAKSSGSSKYKSPKNISSGSSKFYSPKNNSSRNHTRTMRLRTIKL